MNTDPMRTVEVRGLIREASRRSSELNSHLHTQRACGRLLVSPAACVNDEEL